MIHFISISGSLVVLISACHDRRGAGDQVRFRFREISAELMIMSDPLVFTLIFVFFLLSKIGDEVKLDIVELSGTALT